GFGLRLLVMTIILRDQTQKVWQDCILLLGKVITDCDKLAPFLPRKLEHEILWEPTLFSLYSLLKHTVFYLIQQRKMEIQHYLMSPKVKDLVQNHLCGNRYLLIFGFGHRSLGYNLQTCGIIICARKSSCSYALFCCY